MTPARQSDAFDDGDTGVTAMRDAGQGLWFPAGLAMAACDRVWSDGPPRPSGQGQLRCPVASASMANTLLGSDVRYICRSVPFWSWAAISDNSRSNSLT